MKYHASTLHGKHYIQFPGFGIVTETRFGADKLAEELNRLDERVKFFGGSHPKRHEGVTVDGKRYLLESIVEEDLAAQVEAKNNALRKVTDLEALGVELELKLKGTPSNRALKYRLSTRTSQVRELLDVLERCQGILAAYVQPKPHVRPRAALSDLLDILDDGALVTRINHLSEMIKKRPLGWEVDNGSVELTKADKLKILKALKSSVVSCYPGMWSEELAGVHEEALRILGASEDSDVANGSEEKFPQVEDETLVTIHPLLGVVDVKPVIKELIDSGWSLKIETRADGGQYVSGIGVGIEQPFIVQSDKTYVNGACLDKLTSTISKTQLGEAIHKGFERVVNNTTNNFVPEYRLRRKERAALESAINKLEENPGDIGLTPDEEAAQRLRKLLKKLS